MGFLMGFITGLINVGVQIGLAIIGAIPLTICWNNLAPKYLSMIPELYQKLPYWNIVGIIIISVFVGGIIQNLIPTIATVKTTTEKRGK